MIQLIKAQQEIERYLSIFRYYQNQIDNIKELKETEEYRKNMVVNFGSLLSRQLIPDARISKKDIRDTVERIRKRSRDPLFQLRRAFIQDFNDLEQLLEECVILKFDGTRIQRQPISYVSQVNRVQKLETKLSYVLEGLERLTLLRNNLMLKKEYKKIKEEKIREKEEKKVEEKKKIADEKKLFEKKKMSFFQQIKQVLMKYKITFLVAFGELILIILAFQFTQLRSVRILIYTLIPVFFIAFVLGFIFERRKK